MGVEELFPVRGSDLLQTLALSSSAATSGYGSYCQR